MKLILRWFIYAAGLMLVAYLIPGVVVSGFYSALITALILGLINALIRPILILLTLPINILSLGLFTLVINALLIWFTSSVVEGFEVAGFAAALWTAFIMWIISWITNVLLKEE